MALSFSTGSPSSGAIPSISISNPVSVSQIRLSFRDVVQRVSAPLTSSLLVQESPSLVIPMGQDVDEEEEYYKSMSLFCCFNVFWPKLVDLNSWISATGIPIMQQQALIHPCAKGFFIVDCIIEEYWDMILNSGPWFCGNSGLCMKPLTPSFNPATAIFSYAPVWVILPHMTLHFLVLPSLEVISPFWKSSTLKAMKLQGTTPPLLPVFAWKWTSVKDSQLKLFLLVKNIICLRNQTLREFPFILVLKWVILQPIVLKGLGRIESFENPLGGWDLMKATKWSQRNVDNLLKSVKSCLNQILLFIQLHYLMTHAKNPFRS